VERLRDELRFSSVDALIQQMRLDVVKAREIMAAYRN
jgi:FAD synthase